MRCPKHALKAGVTLVEMLVVLALMALIAAVISIPSEINEEERVLQAGRELQGAFEKARTLAMRTQRQHAVAIHIENAGDGSVLRNGSLLDEEDSPDRHWFCIYQSDISQYSDNKRAMPNPGSHDNTANTVWKYSETMDLLRVGERIYLPKGVRFLALTDMEGNTTYRDKESHPPDAHPTLPRPWYGYYVPPSGTAPAVVEKGRLYAWGGYDRDVEAYMDANGSNGADEDATTALHYEGQDNSRVVYDIDQDTNIWITEETSPPGGHYGHISSTVPQKRPKSGSTDPLNDENSLHAQDPRPVVDGNIGSFMIVFDPNGESFLRAPRRDIPMAIQNPIPHFFDRASRWDIDDVDDYDEWPGRMSMNIYSVHSKGGIHVTLARDVDPDDLYDGEQLYDPNVTSSTGDVAYNRFDSAEKALYSISPYCRVYVNFMTGESVVKSMRHPDAHVTASDLSSQDPYPND